jgi:hypothetical protein
MLKLHIAPMLALLVLLSVSLPSHAFFDPPWITPEIPMAGETVFVNIRFGVCDAIFEEAGYPQITQEGNAIRMRWAGDHWPEGSGMPLCGYPIGTFTPPVGAYPAGDYTLTVELAYIDYFEGPSILTIGVVPFTVAAAPAPVTVPTLNMLGMLVLLVFVVSMGGWMLRARRLGLLVLAMACFPLGVRAQDMGTIRVLLSNAPGAPTPDSVLAWVNSSTRAAMPPLAAFKTKSPQAGSFIIADRATGDFKSWLDANPRSARKQLEDTLLFAFPPLDIPAALAALQADPYVAQASEAPAYATSSVALTDFDIVQEPAPWVGNSQYGLYGMNVDAAWKLAGGYALVGQIDMGLYENHAALRQWSGNTYVGGNFIKTASRDVGLTGQPAQTGFDPLNVDEKKLMWINAGSCTTVGAMLPPATLGHGTHVAGLLAANSASGLDVQGTCKQCGIQMYKTFYLACVLTTPRRSHKGSTKTVSIAAKPRLSTPGSKCSA